MCIYIYTHTPPTWTFANTSGVGLVGYSLDIKLDIKSGHSKYALMFWRKLGRIWARNRPYWAAIIKAVKLCVFIEKRPEMAGISENPDTAPFIIKNEIYKKL